MKNVSGYTLMELLVTVAILSIVSFYAVPGFGAAIQNNRLKSSANSVYALFLFARGEAAQKGISVSVGALDNNSWAKGAIAWVDNDGNLQFDAAKDTELRRSVSGYDLQVDEASGIKSVVINGKGYSSSALTIGFCDSRDNETGKQLRLLVSGISIVAEKEDC